LRFFSVSTLEEIKLLKVTFDGIQRVNKKHVD
jgi:hypothetical protein